MTLNENPENFFAQIEQAAFAPSNTVPGIGFSPDKMLLGRVFAYADAHRARIGTNFDQLPVNRPVNGPSNRYAFDGHMTFDHSGSAPVYAPNSFGRGYADQRGAVAEGWEADGETYALHAEDDDWTQAGILVRDVFDDAARDRFVDTVAGSLAGVRDDVLKRSFEYWMNVDHEIGTRIEDAVRSAGDSAPPAGMENGVHTDGIVTETRTAAPS